MEGTHTMPEPTVPSTPPPPPVPPTPPVPLASLLAREDLALRQIAGPRDPGLAVHWAHTSEMADPYPYLLGGELLLTAGVHIPEAAGSEAAGSDGGAPGPARSGAEDYFDDYVSRIVAAGGAALGFGLAPVHDTVPRALVAACDAHALPLLEVPPQTTFSGVARAVWQLMAQARHAELRRVTEAQQSLAAAASRPDPVPSVLRQLARRVGGRAVLYGPEGTEIAAAGTEPGNEVGPALAELARVVRPGSRPAPASATDTTGGTHLAAYALGAGRGFVLGVAAARREPGDHTIASVAAVLLSLLTGEHRSGTEAARSSALVRLLLGAPPESVAPLLGGERWQVVHGRPEEQGPDAVAASALGAALGSPLVDLGDGIVRVLVPGEREPLAQPGWTLGVSEAVAPADWPAADTRAGRALARARATRAPLVRHGARPALADLVPPDEAAAHARTLLAPLGETLADTLRTWLSLHGSWDRTAVALGVHRNTVRQRIARCAALLGTDLDDPDVRMELWFALRQR
ncbi:PucR family transcriptional regulator [Streptomyces phaeoluteigriseus]|uniref:PucR family transcriptional regulator n=1 Tax=Streptomyces phaeoluteigriseus TaxID=114686 RepID=A0ABY4ZJ06_9ACTN|nr:PucR family transcriptional regulator [Streptomyces phaeoluteigriseus]USQ88475.1 PucR family transcriptional regulator [Streptomyces phaeoluteigriseus]